MDTPDRKQKKADDERVEEAGEESFPASDPPSWTPGKAGMPRKKDQRGDDPDAG